MKDIKQLATDLARHQKELKQYITGKAPRIIGKMGVDHFKENFDQEGFVNNGVQPWPQRQADTGRKILTGDTRELQDSIDYETSGGTIGWGSDVPYFEIHNRGGKTKAHTIKPRRGKALKFAGKDGSVIRKKVNHPGSQIPKRQMVGHSEEFIEKIDKRVETDLNNIFNK
jgi:phage gpG-like protein